VLVNISNDGWFGPSGAGRRQHLQVAQLRAIELATPVVRAANTGMSASIAADGRILAFLPANKAGSLLAQVTPAASGLGEPYAVLTGDLVAWTALGLLGAVGLSRRPRRSAALG
jgi:apolipoprotein N-acyltransferase